MIHQTRCTTECKVLVILDNHESHIFLCTIDEAKANGIVLLIIPPHTSHRLQPLDKTVFGPFKASYNLAMDVGWGAIQAKQSQFMTFPVWSMKPSFQQCQHEISNPDFSRLIFILIIATFTLLQISLPLSWQIMKFLMLMHWRLPTYHHNQSPPIQPKAVLNHPKWAVFNQEIPLFFLMRVIMTLI